MTLEWNQRLYTTAGYCRYSKRSSTDKPRTAKIELSIKVCDSPGWFVFFTLKMIIAQNKKKIKTWHLSCR